MKHCFVIAAVIVLGFGKAHAAIKPCDELKAEIAAKLAAAGAKAYELSIVENGREGDGKVVGSCENGSRKIVYAKQAPQGVAAAPAEPAPAAAPPAPPPQEARAESPAQAAATAQAVEAAAVAPSPAARRSAPSSIKPCDELKAEIAAKLAAAGVKAYELSIVENGREGDGKVVGSCENSSRKIVYAKK